MNIGTRAERRTTKDSLTQTHTHYEPCPPLLLTNIKDSFSVRFLALKGLKGGALQAAPGFSVATPVLTALQATIVYNVVR